ncbi:MAG: DUF4340 domain-containing protein [Bryobacterales bacterium]|nr:DUF4340 domain-containing protein [Bryobacterales bacterium]
MNETTKTLYFVLAAALIAAVAVVVDPSRSTPDVFDDVGEVFFAEFTDPQSPRTIEVIDYDEATATATPLKVEFRDNKWVIPSHHGYPADAEERLATTAAALIELRKDRIVSNLAQEHSDYSVVDPLDDQATSLAGRGKRVRLLDSEGSAIADFIVGKAVDGKSGYRYMRTPGQNRTYEVKTEADVSARFEDWIETDLLKVSPFDLRRIEINSYTINERLGRIENRQQTVLTQQDNKWSYAGQEPNSETMSDLTTALDDLRIVDVQPKPEGLSENLKARSGIQPTMENFRSLQGKGFFPNPYTGQILSNEGEIVVDSKDGLRYTLRFGEIAAGGPGGQDSEASEEAEGERRYLMISVEFSEDRASAHEGDATKGKELADELQTRFADWYYVISGADFGKLRPSRTALRAS